MTGPIPGERTSRMRSIRSSLTPCVPIRGSVPARSRAIFARCFQMTTSAKASEQRDEMLSSENSSALTGALAAAAMPATDEMRRNSSSDDPDRGVDHRAGRDQCEQDAEQGRDALPAPELQPHGIEVADHRARRGDGADAELPGHDRAHDPHRRRALERVEQQGQRRQRLAADPQHVGRADVARARRRARRPCRRACVSSSPNGIEPSR